MASEMGRTAHAAHAALRSASLLRPSAPRVQLASKPIVTACQRHMTTSSALCSLNSSGRFGGPLPTQQHRSYSSYNPWTAPTREQRTSEPESEIKKPQTSAYYNPDLTYDDVVDGIEFDIAELKKQKDSDVASLPAAPPKPTMRLVPRLGRTVHVTRNVDVARSFKLLAIQVNQNKIRYDFQSQKFHERPGMKRKRLKSERWQRRFLRGFKETVRRVKELTKQGW